MLPQPQDSACIRVQVTICRNFYENTGYGCAFHVEVHPDEANVCIGNNIDPKNDATKILGGIRQYFPSGQQCA